jgi:phosphopantothenoylcysteine decarboxylase/phosphopantothenate--cysteine ligase
MPQLDGKRIVLGVTGSIAAYKAADLTSQLVKLGADVQVVMTREATEFITPLTLQVLSRNPVVYDLWQEGRGPQPGHIEIADNADLLLVAPASAHTLACFANGLAPDLLTSIYLATPAPVMIAPAMNGKMFNHPATKENLLRLRQRGHAVVDPAEGLLACGYEGVGKLAPVEEIIERITLTSPARQFRPGWKFWEHSTPLDDLFAATRFRPCPPDVNSSARPPFSPEDSAP